MVIWTRATGETNTYYLIDLYEFIRSEHFEEAPLASSLNSSLASFDHHMSKCVENMVTEMRLNDFHSFYKNEDEDVAKRELEKWNETKELSKET